VQVLLTPPGNFFKPSYAFAMDTQKNVFFSQNKMSGNSWQNFKHQI